MHVVESYSADSRLKIDKPFVYQKYFPLTFGDYITLHCSKSLSGRSYGYWSTVTSMLLPALKDRGIVIVQIGEKEDPLVKGCVDLRGRSSINQTSFIINHSLLHLGVESGLTQIASGLGKKIVTVFSPDKKSCSSGPYWSEVKDVVNIDPESSHINSVAPETISRSVCSMLGVDLGYGYDTLFCGSAYDKAIIEQVLDSTVNIDGFSGQTLYLRMDLHHNEECLDKQLGVDCGCEYAIITSKPINTSIIKKHKKRIKVIFYRMDKSHSPSFVSKLLKTGVNYVLCTREQKDFIQTIKIDYLDHGLIHLDNILDPSKQNKLKNENLDDLYFSSNKFIISKQKFYPNTSFWRQGKDTPKIDTSSVFKLSNEDDFWWDTDHVRILKRLDISST